jgi:hypothetical protein
MTFATRQVSSELTRDDRRRGPQLTFCGERSSGVKVGSVLAHVTGPTTAGTERRPAARRANKSHPALRADAQVQNIG